MAEIEDKEWLALLAGKAVSSENTNQKRSADALRAAIKQYDAEELAQANGLKKLMSRMTNEGLFFEPSDISTFKRIIRFVKKIRLLGIFIVGIVAGLMVPMQMATRGASEPIVSKILGDFNNRDHITSEISLIDVNPLNLSENIIFTCISSKVEVKVLSNKEIQMVIYNLKKSDDQQNILKILLGLTSEAEGNIKVTILKQ